MAGQEAKKTPPPKRGPFIKISVTPAQKKVFEKAAEKEGLDVASYARNSMIIRVRAAGFEI